MRLFRRCLLTTGPVENATMSTSEQSSGKRKGKSRAGQTPDQLLDEFTLQFQFLFKYRNDLQSHIITEQEMQTLANGFDSAAVLQEVRRLKEVCYETLGGTGILEALPTNRKKGDAI